MAEPVNHDDVIGSVLPLEPVEQPLYRTADVQVQDLTWLREWYARQPWYMKAWWWVKCRVWDRRPWGRAWFRWRDRRREARGEGPIGPWV